MRPCLALIPSISPLEWRIQPALEEWADVFVLEDGLSLSEELEGRGRSGCVVVGDEFGSIKAVLAAETAPECVQALALGHACLYGEGARRRDVEAEIWDAYKSLARMDYRSFARSLTQVSAGSYDDELVDSFLATVPHEQMIENLDFFDEMLDGGPGLAGRIDALGVPLLLARHSKCLLWARPGFEAARQAFPDATCVTTEDKPSVSQEFAEALRRFCEGLPG